MRKTLIFSFIVLMAFAACDKQIPDLEEKGISQENSTLTIEEMVELANFQYLNGGGTSGQDADFVFAENDGLIDAYTADEKSFISYEKQAENGFLACLRSAEPDSDQIKKIRRTLNAYENRNERIIARHRLAVRQLNERVELRRQGLFRRYQAGLIDLERYRTMLHNLREVYREGLSRIRESNAAAFSASYESLLRILDAILTDEQWEIFTACLEE